MQPEAPVPEYETMPDGKIRFKQPEIPPEQAQAWADQLTTIALKRQGDVERLRLAREKRNRKASRRASSHG